MGMVQNMPFLGNKRQYTIDACRAQDFDQGLAKLQAFKPRA